MSEYEKWLAGDLNWEDLSPDVQARIDDEAMGMAVGDAMHSELLHKSVEEKRFTLGPWYIPNRLDAHNEWTDATELQDGLWNYVRKGDRGIRLQHNRDIVAGEWVEAMQMPVEVTMRKHAGGEEVVYPEGTVFLGVVWKPWAWELVKKGKIRGFSIGGSSARIPIEPVTKQASKPLVMLPGVLVVNGRSYAVKPDGDAIVVSDGHSRRTLDVENLLTAVDKADEQLFGWSYEDRVSVHKQITVEPFIRGFWFQNAGVWQFAKGRFGSRSDAGRYAANIRWQKYGIALREAMDTQVRDMAKAVTFGADGMPEPGPLGMPKTEAGLKLAQSMPSLAGHCDLDAVADEMDKNPDAYSGETAKYALVRQHLTEERRALHDAIMDSEFAGKTGVTGRDPTYTFLGGGGASGKSTILDSGQVDAPTRSIIETKNGPKAILNHSRTSIEINSDDLKLKIPEYDALIDGGSALTTAKVGGEVVEYNPGLSPNPEARFGAASFAHEESSMLSKAINARAIGMGLDIVLDGTADGKPGAQGARINQIAEIGGAAGHKYQTKLVMVSVETDSAVDRSMGRAFKSSRLVPEETLRSAHSSASRAFTETQDMYNSVEGYYTGTRPATKFMEGGNGKITVVDQKLYDGFIAKATEPMKITYKGGITEYLELKESGAVA